ncbi:hypothetical protein PHYBLDRAFT_150187 [Phycomyces blakesleeanus NRRL 1555(-)]|uniref:Chromo domain-containing protein n=1 Tax=Phycomyces blakesleeanus (strain ATCC 8743b / DSM 1359 / FGSC 10004 / NBRC 33097 / NRRL 1555) TaxID=763407 RepID=A0A163D462_PHYB8|nr:hypothetical protein PHYBLDRAFT_150187 [Phycomyces blakesleeanus NRRL 1555(-)]OAD68590.1 hypothetical protein PHYBLDRAFT_150187 [Phycomyces blakesleeanus NRRL 1555(-)]|eukprot:XP_018286630.1 hypothetical protein PHYBLDRAFT_150187 [Phycomyces blakesleeanus NRRL 1555(-)]
MNAKVTKRNGTAPYNLMFARTMNGFKSYANDPAVPSLTEDELQKGIKTMADVVFPAIAERAKAVTNAQKGKFHNKYRMIQFTPNSQVMIKELQQGKLEPAYQGPYTIVREKQGGSYILMDEQGLLMPREYPPSQLKLIPQDKLVSLDEYRVRWEGYEEKDNTWQTPESFSSPKPIADYWDQLDTTPIDKTQTPHQTRTVTAAYISKRRTTQPTPIRQSKRSRC